ncbi:MAG: hypothetical protein KGH71_01990 [Candidatus Micrarchaeota archaeon]|nr:hypothetical protein [Candidatus Micrarchaeota archaeon]
MSAEKQKVGSKEADLANFKELVNDALGAKNPGYSAYYFTLAYDYARKNEIPESLKHKALIQATERTFYDAKTSKSLFFGRYVHPGTRLKNITEINELLKESTLPNEKLVLLYKEEREVLSQLFRETEKDKKPEVLKLIVSISELAGLEDSQKSEAVEKLNNIRFVELYKKMKRDVKEHRDPTGEEFKQLLKLADASPSFYTEMTEKFVSLYKKFLGSANKGLKKDSIQGIEATLSTMVVVLNVTDHTQIRGKIGGKTIKVIERGKKLIEQKRVEGNLSYEDWEKEGPK